MHHDWILRVYEWVELIHQLMSKWKARLEIWNEGEKVNSRWIKILCGFLHRILIHLLLSHWILDIWDTGMQVTTTKQKAFGWENLETEIRHIALSWMIWSNTKEVIKSVKTRTNSLSRQVTIPEQAMEWRNVQR